MFALPFVALTRFGRENDVKRAIAAGFTARLSKPVAIADLIDLSDKLRAPRHRINDVHLHE